MMFKKIKKHCKVIAPVAGSLLATAGVAIASGGGEGGHAAEPVGWLITDTYKVMNFVVLAGAVFYLAKKPVADFFGSRKAKIEKELADLEQKKKDAIASLALYEEKFAKLEEESGKIVAEYVEQGKEAKKRILAEAELEAEKLESNAKKAIEQEFASAKAKLQEEISEKALVKAEEIVKKAISTEDQDRLVDEYLEKVVAS